MTLEAYSDLSVVVRWHIGFALAALIIGPFALFRASRDKWHKCAGYLWVGAMVGLSVSSFFIHNIGLLGPFSPIHLISVFVLWALFEGVRDVYRRDFVAHRKGMQALYVYALCVTGLFTLAPGRALNRMLFDGVNGWALSACLVALGSIVIYFHRRSLLPLGKT